MFRQNVIKKFLINIFTMPKFFYTYKSKELYFLEEGHLWTLLNFLQECFPKKLLVKSELIFRATKLDIFFPGKWSYIQPLFLKR